MGLGWVPTISMFYMDIVAENQAFWRGVDGTGGSTRMGRLPLHPVRGGWAGLCVILSGDPIPIGAQSKKLMCQAYRRQGLSSAG